MVIAATTLDVPVSTWAHDHHLDRTLKAAWWSKVVKAPGHFGLTVALAAVVVALTKRWQPAAALLLAGITSGLLYTIAKWVVGRTRPFKGVPPFEFHSFAKGIAGLWRAENMAFPSGHACLAFATAAGMTLIYPRLGWLFYLLATATGVERILEGAHYPSDVAAALVLGVLSAIAAWRVVQVPSPREPAGFEVVAVPGNP